MYGDAFDAISDGNLLFSFDAVTGAIKIEVRVRTEECARALEIFAALVNDLLDYLTAQGYPHAANP